MKVLKGTVKDLNINVIGIKENIGVAVEEQKQTENVIPAMDFGFSYGKAAALEVDVNKKNQYKEKTATVVQQEEENPVKQMKDSIDDFLTNVTADDMSLMEEMGFAPKSEEPEKIVTVNDRIKIELATHCDNYTVYGQIDMDMLKEVYGDSPVAYSVAASLKNHNMPVTEQNIEQVQETLKRAQSLEPINVQSQSYLLNNELSLSVENVYTAQHAEAQSAVDYANTELSDEQWQDLRGQVMQMFEKNGIEPDVQNIENAKYMIENKIPVTPENISKMKDMQAFDVERSDEEWIETIVAVMAVGEPAEHAMIIGADTALEQVEEFTHTIESVGDEELIRVVDNNYTLNKNTLENEKKNAQEEVSDAYEENMQEPKTFTFTITAEEMKKNAKAEAQKEETTVELKRPVMADFVENMPRTKVADEKTEEFEPTQKSETAQMPEMREKTEKPEVRFETFGKTEMPVAAEKDMNIEVVRARRQLEEIRLTMTASAGIKMISKGIDINISPIEDIVKQLRMVENEYAHSVFSMVGYRPGQKDVELFRNTVATMEQIKEIPKYVLGNIVSKKIDFTIESIYTEGKQIQNSLKTAGMRYETMMTVPREDLGDSLEKAFTNVDDMLEDLDLNTSEINRRSVRILAYHHMEITTENIEKVKYVDMEVTRMIDGMKPKVVCDMISKGINPLDTDISQLNDMLEEMAEESGAKPEEKYSEYLWKLQRDDGINEHDRKIYIGVYRLLNMIEKRDRSLIGELIEKELPVTINNMVRALKSESKKSVDVSVDENTGFLGDIRFDENSLAGLLSGFGDRRQKKEDRKRDQDRDESDKERFNRQAVEKINEEITPHKISMLMEKGDFVNTPAEEILEQIAIIDEKEQSLEKMYQEAQLEQINETVKNVDEDVLRMLLDSNQAPTVENVMTAQMIMSEGMKVFKTVRDLDDDDEIDEEFDKLEEFDGDADELKKVYKKAENAVLSTDVTMENAKMLLDMKKVFHLMHDMSRNELYHVPVEIEGENALIRLRIISGGAEKGKVTADLFSEAFGKIYGEFKLKGKKLDGMMVCENSNIAEKLENALPMLEKRYEEAGYEVLGVNSNNAKHISHVITKSEKNEKVNNIELYKVAKIFVAGIKEMGKELIDRVE